MKKYPVDIYTVDIFLHFSGIVQLLYILKIIPCKENIILIIILGESSIINIWQGTLSPPDGSRAALETKRFLRPPLSLSMYFLATVTLSFFQKCRSAVLLKGQSYCSRSRDSTVYWSKIISAQRGHNHVLPWNTCFCLKNIL